jgi:hypothetical protein
MRTEQTRITESDASLSEKDSAARTADTAAIDGQPRHRRFARVGASLGHAALPAAIVLAPLALIAWCFWPGHMNADAITQIVQASTGDFTNHHDPLLMAIWRPFYELGFGPGWVLGLHLLTFGAGCWLLLRTVLPRLPAAVATAAISLSPPVFGMLGNWGRDAQFTALLLLTSGLTARAISDPGRRRLWIVLAIVAAWLTLAARQNAAPIVVGALAVIGGLLLSGRVVGRGRQIAAAIGVGVLLTVALMATQFGANAALGVRDVNAEQWTMVYDLAAISHRERENLFPRSAMPQRGMRPIDRFWNVDLVNAYLLGPDAPVRYAANERMMSSLRDAWLDAIADHPIAYLAARFEIQGRQLGIGRPAAWIYHPVIDGNAVPLRNPGANEAAKDYVEGFADKNLDGRAPFYLLWLYLLLAVAAGAWLLRRAGDSPGLLAVGALGIGALTFQFGLLFGAMGVGYRLEFPMVVVSIVCTVVAVAHARTLRRARAR